MAYGKKPLKESFKAAVKWGVKWTLIGCVVGGPAYYEYGTVQEQEVKIISIDKVLIEQPAAHKEVAAAPAKAQPTAVAKTSAAPADKNVKTAPAPEAVAPTPAPVVAAPVSVTLPASAYEYTIKTDKGSFKNKDSYAHIKFDSEDVQDKLVVGQTYHIKSYGRRLALPVKSWSFYPNILSVEPVTAQQPQAQQPAALSGETVSYPVKVGDIEVQITAPVEVKDKITVERAAVPATAPQPQQQVAAAAPRPSTP